MSLRISICISQKMFVEDLGCFLYCLKEHYLLKVKLKAKGHNEILVGNLQWLDTAIIISTTPLPLHQTLQK